MVFVENKKANIGSNEVTYAELLLAVTDQPSREGYSIAEIEQRLAIRRKADKEKEAIELEDAEYKKLCELLDSMRWAIVSEEIVEFHKYIKGLN